MSRPSRIAGPLPRLVLLQAALYAAYGVESPFLPSFLGERGLSAAEIGLVLAVATVVRIAAGPVAGHLADRLDATRTVLGVAAAAAGAVSFAYLAGTGFWPLLAVAMLHAAVLAPLAPLADALALGAARGGAFRYGWVRGAGSAAFVVGTLSAGQFVGPLGLGSVVVASGLLFLAMAASTAVAPAVPHGERAGSGLSGARALLGIPAFRRVTVVAALVIGSHALNDTFAVIRWREAGVGPGAASLLWSVAVLSEVVVFLLAGPWLLDRLGPARAAMLAAGAGAARWALMGLSASLPLAACAQAMHGLTFALLHLAAMRVIAGAVPPRLSATAQTVYGTFGLGVASALLTAGSGALYGSLGAGAFWAMAGLCAVAVPLTAGLDRAK